MYEYRATILRVVDGDTVHAIVDLGFDAHLNLTLRLAGIDAPELPTPEGEAAKGFLRGQVDGKTVTIRTIKDRKEKFGRYLATIIVEGTDINVLMVEAGHARAYP